MPESTLSPALAYTYCDQRCERCPLQSECEVAAASGGDQPLPASPQAYAEQRERRAELVHEALDER
ncbi:MAG: hypothetical protein KDD82_17040, partial [Planctomycetes bacterium]|nr:hypothetical protein [Planctomycetota bacterium]